MNSLLKKAIRIAEAAHEGQVDKAGAEYINHPKRVMDACNSLDAKIVAILHDVIEDTPITYDTLREEGIPEYILEALDGVTRRVGESYSEFINRCKLNPLSKIVKEADLIDNMNLTRLPIVTKADLNRFEKYRKAFNKLMLE